MYIEAVPNRNSPPAVLLRESYREKGRVRKRTLCNLTNWPSHLIEGLRALLKGGSVLPPGSGALTIRRSLPHGHVAAVLGLGAVDEDELYTALDWLAERQPAIEAALARRHLADGTLVLYDVSSSYLEGRCCELASFGHNRDGKKGKPQIVYGLLCAADGCPSPSRCSTVRPPTRRRSPYRSRS